MMTGSVYEFSFYSLDNQKVIKLADFKGKVILIVNTASKCGFTPQYRELQTLWDEHNQDGLMIIGVPCNDFGSQEPGDEAAIQTFCDTHYHVTFPLTEKCSVVGEGAHPFYRYARTHLGFIAAPKWNFHKYVINKNGELIDWFSSATNPSGKKIKNTLEKLLQASA